MQDIILNNEGIIIGNQNYFRYDIPVYQGNNLNTNTNGINIQIIGIILIVIILLVLKKK